MKRQLRDSSTALATNLCWGIAWATSESAVRIDGRPSSDPILIIGRGFVFRRPVLAGSRGRDIRVSLTVNPIS